MARARNIKPGIMENEDLAELGFAHRLLFIYLWMLADKAGRMQDRPKRIKAQAFPYDDGMDVDSMLDDLAKAGFIHRYDAAGTAAIQVLNFSKHQTPHVREQASNIPEPEQKREESVQDTAQDDTNNDLGSDRHNLGSALQSPRSPDSLIVDSLIVDSLIGDIPPDGDAVDVPSVKPKPTPAKPKTKAPAKTSLPAGFAVSEAVQAWAEREGHSRHLQTHFKHFVGAAIAKGYAYANWDQALMNAIRDNWAKVGLQPLGAARPLNSRDADTAAKKAEFLRLMGAAQNDGKTIEMEQSHARL